MAFVVEEHTPVSLTFSHGNLLPEKVDHIRCEMLSEITRPKKVAKVVISSDDPNSNADLYLGNADNSNLCDNFIVLHNRASNSVRFYPVNNFFVNPYHGQEERPITFETDTRTTRQSLSDLNKFMGSKKSKSRLMAVERNAANLSDLNDTLTQVAESNNSTIESPSSSSPVSNIDFLPPCDRNAKKVEDAYKLHDLVAEDILDSLDSITEEVLKMDLITLASDTRFSSFMMKAASHIPKDRLKYKLLIFVDRLLAFNKSPARLMSVKSHSFCSFSDLVHEKLIQDFSIPGLGNKRLRPTVMRDKILCYAMVLIMMCSGYEIDIGMLADIVNPTEHKRLPLLLKALGAKSGRLSPSIFKLKVPIGEPPVKKRRSSMKFQ